MPDMLVKLFNFPSPQPTIDAQRAAGVVIRRARPYEIARVAEFVVEHFRQSWADEISVGYANKPTSVFIAIRDGEVIGFGAYECTCRGFFGPTGVMPSERGKGIGGALLLACLQGMKEVGYNYAIIGGAGPTEFYAKTCGAIPIADSEPGIYTDALSKR
ncbi:MAG: GNAT family N-acetyltransferase [Tepidisphaeraceae bacterium]